jgi:hypothetical protein
MSYGLQLSCRRIHQTQKSGSLEEPLVAGDQLCAWRVIERHAPLTHVRKQYESQASESNRGPAHYE